MIIYFLKVKLNYFLNFILIIIIQLIIEKLQDNSTFYGNNKNKYLNL